MKTKKGNRGGAGRGQGAKVKVFSEPIIEKKIRIPKSKEQFFSNLAKVERNNALIK